MSDEASALAAPFVKHFSTARRCEGQGCGEGIETIAGRDRLSILSPVGLSDMNGSFEVTKRGTQKRLPLAAMSGRLRSSTHA